MSELGPLIDPSKPVDSGLFEKLGAELRIGIVTGVNGSGKTTTTKELSERTNTLSLITRHTTKQLRESDYIYKQIEEAGFKAMLEADEFVEAALYGPGYYGTSITETQRSLSRSVLAICEMDPRASLIYKQRMRNVGNVGVHLYFLNPFGSDELDSEAKLHLIQGRAGQNREASVEERDRYIKAATYTYDDDGFNMRISTVNNNPDEVARLIFDDLVS